MPEDDITIGELGRRVDVLTVSISTLTETITKVATRDAADLVRFEALDNRIRRLETGTAWLIGLVVAAVLAAVLKGVTL